LAAGSSGLSKINIDNIEDTMRQRKESFLHGMHGLAEDQVIPEIGGGVQMTPQIPMMGSVEH
jgi:hypothetical protein